MFQSSAYALDRLGLLAHLIRCVVIDVLSWIQSYIYSSWPVYGAKNLHRVKFRTSLSQTWGGIASAWMCEEGNMNREENNEIKSTSCMIISEVSSSWTSGSIMAEKVSVHHS